ncbi:MAG: hypothetical protein ACLFVD_04625 [Dehalococcoidia bacterium]
MTGKAAGKAAGYGGLVEVTAGDAKIVFGDWVNLRYYSRGEQLPDRQQLLLVFDGGWSLVGSVQMYGGLWSCDHRYRAPSLLRMSQWVEETAWSP